MTHALLYAVVVLSAFAFGFWLGLVAAGMPPVL